jgi:hypothetical protein
VAAFGGAVVVDVVIGEVEGFEEGVRARQLGQRFI